MVRMALCFQRLFLVKDSQRQPRPADKTRRRMHKIHQRRSRAWGVICTCIQNKTGPILLSRNSLPEDCRVVVLSQAESDPDEDRPVRV